MNDNVRSRNDDKIREDGKRGFSYELQKLIVFKYKDKEYTTSTSSMHYVHGKCHINNQKRTQEEKTQTDTTKIPNTHANM